MPPQPPTQQQPNPKHKRYEAAYKPGDLYWGLGIENETYIEMSGKMETVAEFIRSRQARERYSVNYWEQYKPGTVKKVVDKWITTLPQKEHTPIQLPIYLNAHSLQNTDRLGNAKTTYTKSPEPNKAWRGTSLLEDLAGMDPTTFKEGKDVWWTLDGDSIEFMTQDFYCATIEDVVEELVTLKGKWLTSFGASLAAMKAAGHLDPMLGHSPKFPQKNYGFAVYQTNRRNVGIFNNGTYHINITLPTYLDKDARIADPATFKEQHRAAARLFQWITPFLVAKFGSGDPFAELEAAACSPLAPPSFPKGSQRLCASRYVGAGLYDTEKMEEGKLLTVPYKRKEGRWYEQIYDGATEPCSYKVLPALGLDINFNKHLNHGLELRIFDWFPEEDLPDLLRLLIWMCDEALSRGSSLPDPLEDRDWNRLMAAAIWKGRGATLGEEDIRVFSEVLGLKPQPQPQPPLKILEVYESLWWTWKRAWNDKPGPCTSRMIRRGLPLEAQPEPPTPPPTPTTPLPSPPLPLKEEETRVPESPAEVQEPPVSSCCPCPCLCFPWRKSYRRTHGSKNGVTT